MKRGSAIIIALVLMLTLIVALGCGIARRGEPIMGPLPIQNEQVARGERLFMTHCQQCHPGGTAGLGPALNDKPLPGFLIRTQVRTGMGAMPSFSEDEIADEELDAIIAYLITLRRHEK